MRTAAPSVLHLATELLEAHQFGAVVELCEAALGAGADDAPTRLLLTRALLGLDRDTEARLQLRRCAELDPYCPETYRLLARVAIRCHDQNAARLFHREANQLEERSAAHARTEIYEWVTTETWDGTTLEHQAPPTCAEPTVPRGVGPTSSCRARTRLERPRRVFAVGTELGERTNSDMETTQRARGLW